MRLAGLILAALVLATLAGAVVFRLAPMPAARWHVDPDSAIAPASPNFARIAGAEAPVLEGDLATIAARLAGVAQAEGARPIAGDAAQGFVTYVARSRLMGFPDAISVKLTVEGDGQTRVAIVSRSRFGHSDLGVNRARIDRWLAALQP